MNRKFLAMLGVLSVAAVLACGIGRAVPARAQTAGGTVSAPAVNVPKTYGNGGVLTPDTEHRCPPGNLLYVFPDGGGACLGAAPKQPPRSQADCPRNTQFAIIGKVPGCVGGGPFIIPTMRRHRTDASTMPTVAGIANFATLPVTARQDPTGNEQSSSDNLVYSLLVGSRFVLSTGERTSAVPQ